jgi:hypothetical protein
MEWFDWQVLLSAALPVIRGVQASCALLPIQEPVHISTAKSEQVCVSGPMPVSSQCHGTGKVCDADLTALQALQLFSLTCQTHATYRYTCGHAQVGVSLGGDPFCATGSYQAVCLADGAGCEGAGPASNPCAVRRTAYWPAAG